MGVTDVSTVADCQQKRLERLEDGISSFMNRFSFVGIIKYVDTSSYTMKQIY